MKQSIEQYTNMYRQLDNYRKLSKSDQAFFDTLFKTLYFNQDIKYTNKTFQNAFGEAESTIHHRLDRITKSGLIVRDTEKKKDKNGNWYSSRRISLNQLLFGGIYDE